MYIQARYLLRSDDHLGRELAGEIFLRVRRRDAHEDLSVLLPGEVLDVEGQSQLLELLRLVRLQLDDLEQDLCAVVVAVVAPRERQKCETFLRG